MEANYNKILGIQKCKQRARNKLRTMCKIQKTCEEREIRIQQEQDTSDHSNSDMDSESDGEENDP